ncbi:MAG: NUDIX hydrolase [Thermaerobacter sp.]|nr:NUDIX hydrolase [Thermaerobacter sp.]
MDRPHPRVIARQTLYEGPFSVQLDELSDSDRTYRRAWVQHPGAVVLVPIQGDEVLLVRQYRHATGEDLLELPAGTLEPEEPPEETARRELQEECGYLPRVLRPLLRAYAAPGYSSEVYHFFLAEDLVLSRLPGDEDEDIEVVRMALREAQALARRGMMGDAKTALGLLLVP